MIPSGFFGSNDPLALVIREPSDSNDKILNDFLSSEDPIAVVIPQIPTCHDMFIVNMKTKEIIAHGNNGWVIGDLDSIPNKITILKLSDNSISEHTSNDVEGVSMADILDI